VWDKVVAQKGALPPSKVVLEAKNRQKTKYDIFFYFFLFFLFVFMFFNFKLKYDQYFPFRATSMHFVACS